MKIKIDFLWKWIMEHLSYVQGILVLSVTVIAAITGYVKNYYLLIVALLIFVGTEFTLITIGYLELILKHVSSENDKTGKVSEVVINDHLEWKDLVSKSKNDIFISGVTLGSLYNERRFLEGIPENIKVNLLVHDVTNDEVTRQYCLLCVPKASFMSLKNKQGLFMNLANDLGKKKNMTIRMTDQPLYIQFVGCDVFDESNTSYIRAQHCLRKRITGGKDSIDDKMILGVDGKKELYRVYKNQISILWESAKSYSTEGH